tara:strand:- start:2234 stop:2515 length:282 start_codon:yes stop_codon:yes gene_type:complete
MKRADVLSKAAEYITTDRAATHGDAENNFGSIARGWDWWLSMRPVGPLTPYDVAMMMTVFKVARSATNETHSDNQIDLAGYAAIAAELGNGYK